MDPGGQPDGLTTETQGLAQRAVPHDHQIMVRQIAKKVGSKVDQPHRVFLILESADKNDRPSPGSQAKGRQIDRLRCRILFEFDSVGKHDELLGREVDSMLGMLRNIATNANESVESTCHLSQQPTAPALGLRNAKPSHQSTDAGPSHSHRTKNVGMKEKRLHQVRLLSAKVRCQPLHTGEPLRRSL